MTEWPNALALQRAITWNRTQLRRSEHDVLHAHRVPRSATRRVYQGGRARTVALTLDEYRASRATDSLRFSDNISALQARL